MSDSFEQAWEVNKAAALYDGTAYAEMLALLGRARQSVRMSFFLFGGLDANRMMDVLAERRAVGVEVRVLLDRSVGLDGLLPGILWECRRAYRRLLALGIDVCLSDARPLPDRPGKRTLWHHKYLVVDDREAMVGGMNVGTLFRRYHDLMVHLTGPTAAALGRQFDGDWHYAKDPRLPRPQGVPPPPVDADPPPLWSGQTSARLLGTGLGRRSTEAGLRQNLRRGRTSVCIAVCEMGRTDLLDEVIACHVRGVSVRVLLCPLKISPLLPPGLLNAGAVETLRRAGVPVHLYNLGPDFVRMHQKLAIFDGERAVAGSTNWTRSGFGWIGETDVELCGGDVVRQLADGFEADWRRSAPATLPSPAAALLHGFYERWTQ